tara:strand:- start:633 stop:785 length:153 start_codon:yes stop_codon:yes gene_type:complete
LIVAFTEPPAPPLLGPPGYEPPPPPINVAVHEVVAAGQVIVAKLVSCVAL